MVITNSRINYSVTISNGLTVKIFKGTHTYPDSIKEDLKKVVSRTSFLSEGVYTEIEPKKNKKQVKKAVKKRTYTKGVQSQKLDEKPTPETEVESKEEGVDSDD